MPAPRNAPRPLRALTLAVLAGVSAFTLLVFGAPAHATPSEQDLIKQIDAKSQQFNKIVEQYDKVKSDMDENQKELKTLRKRLKPMEIKVNDAQEKVGAMAASAYRGGKASALNSVLSNGSASTLLDSMSLLNQMARSQHEQVASVIKLKTQLDKQQKKLDDANTKLAKQKADLGKKKKDLDKQVGKLRQMRIDAYGAPVNASNIDYGPPPEIPGSAGKAVSYAWNALGSPYDYGAAGPNSYDCSGLTMAAWGAAGYGLPHNTVSQFNATHRINRDDLQPGDLVFYYDNNHVGIYIGGGQVIHAPTYGEPVQKAGVDSMPANGYGRVG
ncbi:MAG: NlpC/P60 family protein [Actinocatenispora sp.]